MSVTGVEDISLTKEDFLESKQFASTARKIIFAHKASGGESGINLLSLSTPPELSANGFVQPPTAEISSSRLLFNKKNFRLISSAPERGELWMHDHYVITSEGFISFLNGITALPGEIFRGEIIDVPQTAIVTADARSVTRTFQLAVGQTLLNLGALYKVGENLTANSQIGSIKVWRNGTLQMRNVGNAVASPSADGNYQEYDPANLGTSNQIQFNIAPVGQADEIIVEFGLHVFSGDVEIYGAIEQLYGILFKLAQDAAPAFGNSLSTYLSANPSQVERRQFGDKVFEIRNRVNDLIAQNNLLRTQPVNLTQYVDMEPAATNPSVSASLNTPVEISTAFRLTVLKTGKYSFRSGFLMNWVGSGGFAYQSQVFNVTTGLVLLSETYGQERAGAGATYEFVKFCPDRIFDLIAGDVLTIRGSITGYFGGAPSASSIGIYTSANGAGRFAYWGIKEAPMISTIDS